MVPSGGIVLSRQMRPTMNSHLHSQVQYLPITPGLFALLVLAFGALIILIQLGILRYAYMKLGISSGAAMLLLLGSLIGSYFNIPLTVLPGQTVRSGEIIDYFGMQYVVPLVQQWPGTVLAVNIGGAVIPAVMSTYLVLRYQLWARASIAVLIIAVIIHAMATPVRGVGIAVPVFAPVVVTAILAYLLSRDYAAPLAYIGGSMGTLVGADLMNLDKIGSLGAPVASIGGAGTFDGVFLTGILSVLLAGLAAPSRPGLAR
jgi:uncharacterized membrane protein